MCNTKHFLKTNEEIECECGAKLSGDGDCICVKLTMEEDEIMEGVTTKINKIPEIIIKGRHTLHFEGSDVYYFKELLQMAKALKDRHYFKINHTKLSGCVIRKLKDYNQYEFSEDGDNDTIIQCTIEHIDKLIAEIEKLEKKVNVDYDPDKTIIADGRA